MTKQERLAAYRCAIIAGMVLHRGNFNPETVEAAALEALRAETDGIDRECDVGSCDKVAEPGDEFCKFHFEQNR